MPVRAEHEDNWLREHRRDVYLDHPAARHPNDVTPPDDDRSPEEVVDHDKICRYPNCRAPVPPEPDSTHRDDEQSEPKANFK